MDCTKWEELKERSNCGHILVFGFCANCKSEIITRQTRLRDGIKFCNNCRGCKYKDFKKGEQMKSLYIGVDFDGTVVTHKYPEIGEPIDLALDVLEELQDAGHKLILYTMRSGERLVEAVEYLEENGIKLWAVNENPSQKYWTESPKIFCNVYIDDAALGCPLDEDHEGARPIVDWYEVQTLLHQRNIL